MTFLIDNFFLEALEEKYGVKITYKEFKEFHKDVRAKKKSLGLVKSSSREMTDIDMHFLNMIK